jgi:hypothetical protein
LLAELTNWPIQGRGDADSVNLVAFPAGHIAGVINICVPAVLGGSSVFMDAWRPALAAELIARYHTTSTSGTPFHLQGLIEAADGTDQLATLRGFLLGAATVTYDLVWRAITAGTVTYRTYGTTEHPTITACAMDDPLTARLETEGSPLPGCQVQIVDESGSPVPAGAKERSWPAAPTNASASSEIPPCSAMNPQRAHARRRSNSALQQIISAIPSGLVTLREMVSAVVRRLRPSERSQSRLPTPPLARTARWSVPQARAGLAHTTDHDRDNNVFELATVRIRFGQPLRGPLKLQVWLREKPGVRSLTERSLPSYRPVSLDGTIGSI